MAAMTRLPKLLALPLAVALASCGGRMITTDGGGGDTDAGTPGVDSGSPSMDAGAPVDSGTPPPVDRGPPDAGPPACPCPTLPSTCTAPPVNTPTFTPDGTDMLEQLFDVIACANDTLEIAAYQGNWECLSGAINARLAADSDLTVTIVVDNEDCEPGRCLADDLVPTDRVTVVRDSRSSNLMHHKFVIADGARLWLASANFTQHSFCGDHNNAIVVEQTEIVERMQTELQRMAGGSFGPLTGAAAERTVAGPYTLYFSPVSPANDTTPWFVDMQTAIGDATSTIEVVTNAWTRSEIANALAAAAEDGVTVRALVSNLYADDLPAQILAMEGIDVRRGRFHDKVMIIDGQIVITGSANWSANAWTNNENQLWIDDAAVAAAYRADFEAVFAGATPVEVSP